MDCENFNSINDLCRIVALKDYWGSSDKINPGDVNCVTINKR